MRQTRGARDFAGITRTSTACYLLVAAPALGVSTAKDLLALARAKPGQLNFASAGAGSATHFAAEMLKHHAKIDVVHVPYKGIPEALTDVMAGRVQFFPAAPRRARRGACAHDAGGVRQADRRGAESSGAARAAGRHKT